MISDFAEIQKKALKKNSLYWNNISKKQNWTENIHYYKDTASYYVSPYSLPPLNTFITRVTTINNLQHYMNESNTSIQRQFKRIIKIELDFCLKSLKTLKKLKDLENKF